MSFAIRERRVVQEAGFLTLEECRMVGPDGDEATRYVVHHPGAVAVVPVDPAGQVVFVRQYRVAADRDLLEIPAGKREPGEPPEQTAARELEEEIGMTPGRLVELARFYNSPGFCDEHTHVYLALDLEPVEVAHHAKAEERHMTVERLGLEAALDLVTAGEIRDAKTIIGLTLAARRSEVVRPADDGA